MIDIMQLEVIKNIGRYYIARGQETLHTQSPLVMVKQGQICFFLVPQFND